jgi:CRISPR-associated endoribonuclease Cas6
MRLLLNLQSKREQAYQNEYHHKLRGLIWSKLDGTPFERFHDETDDPTFSYSNPFPRKDYKENENSTLIIASIHNEIINYLDSALGENETISIGEMEFTVESTSTLSPDVGEPGTSGIIQCSTGAYIPLHKTHREKFEIADPYDVEDISWTPDHGLYPFKSRITDNIEWKTEKILPNRGSYPKSFDDVFEGVNFGNTYAMEIPVTTGTQIPFIVTQARFSYNVRDDMHRRVLNTLLDTGIGWRTTLGFGFCNIKE